MNPAAPQCLACLAVTVLLSAFGSCEGAEQDPVFEGEISIWITGADEVDSFMLPQAVDGYRVDLGETIYEVGGVDSVAIDTGGEGMPDTYETTFYVRIEGYEGPGSYPAVVEASRFEGEGYSSSRVTVVGPLEHCIATIGENELLGGVDCERIQVEYVERYEDESWGTSVDTASLRASWAGGWVAASSANPKLTGDEAPQ
jgi:hypothetical protein